MDKRILYIKHDKNYGPSVARNTGIENCSGKYIAFQDSDDEWDKNKLKIMVDKLNNTDDEVGLIYSKVLIHRLNGSVDFLPYKWIKKRGGYIFEEILIQNFIDTPSAIVKRVCFEKVGTFDTEFSCLEDYDLFIRISKNYLVEYVDESLLISYETTGGVNSAKKDVHGDMIMKILFKYYNDFENSKKILAAKYSQIADFYCLSGNYKLGINYFYKAVKTKPNNFIFMLLLLFSLSNKFIRVNIYKFARRLIIKLKFILGGRSEVF